MEGNHTGKLKSAIIQYNKWPSAKVTYCQGRRNACTLRLLFFVSLCISINIKEAHVNLYHPWHR